MSVYVVFMPSVGNCIVNNHENKNKDVEFIGYVPITYTHTHPSTRVSDHTVCMS